MSKIEKVLKGFLLVGLIVVIILFIARTTLTITPRHEARLNETLTNSSKYEGTNGDRLEEILNSKAHCEVCGEVFNNYFTVEEDVCDICYGWQEYHKRIKDGTNGMYNREFGDKK